jgi:hypothetical protein
MESVSTQDVAKLAQRFGVSQSAVETLATAVQRGHGTMAQFDHPELGGMGQWTRGGMTMVGDMFNDGLKAKVNAICSELAAMAPAAPAETTKASDKLDNWWGEDFGHMGASGSQNEMRYAYFPAARRLAIRRDNRVTIYDTGEHQIGGVSQQQSAGYSLTFVSQLGLVSLDQLRVVKQ